MTWRRTAHQADAGGDPRLESSAGPRPAPGTLTHQPGSREPDAHRLDFEEPGPHEGELILAAVSTEGLPALVRTLLAARDGDRDAAGMRVGALLRALPETSWFTAHDLVSLAGITETTRVGQLDQVQRSILTRSLSRTPQPARDAWPSAQERQPGG